MIRVQCPSCRIGLQFPPSGRRRHGTCPRCHTRLVVPALAEAAPTPAAGMEVPPPDHIGRFLPWAALVLLALPGAGGLGWYLLSARQGPAPVQERGEPQLAGTGSEPWQGPGKGPAEVDPVLVGTP